MNIWIRNKGCICVLFVISAMMSSHSVAVAGDNNTPEFGTEEWMVLNRYSLFEGTTGFMVGCSLAGSAEEIGIDQDKSLGRVKLRLANTIGMVPIIKGDGSNATGALNKVCLVMINIWTVGDDYPVAYHVKISTGYTIWSANIFETAFLGYGNSVNVQDSINDAIDDLIDNFAVAYHKGVGTF